MLIELRQFAVSNKHPVEVEETDETESDRFPRSGDFLVRYDFPELVEQHISVHDSDNSGYAAGQETRQHQYPHSRIVFFDLLGFIVVNIPVGSGLIDSV